MCANGSDDLEGDIDALLAARWEAEERLQEAEPLPKTAVPAFGPESTSSPRQVQEILQDVEPLLQNAEELLMFAEVVASNPPASAAQLNEELRRGLITSDEMREITNREGEEAAAEKLGELSRSLSAAHEFRSQPDFSRAVEVLRKSNAVRGRVIRVAALGAYATALEASIQTVEAISHLVPGWLKPNPDDVMFDFPGESELPADVSGRAASFLDAIEKKGITTMVLAELRLELRAEAIAAAALVKPTAEPILAPAPANSKSLTEATESPSESSQSPCQFQLLDGQWHLQWFGEQKIVPDLRGMFYIHVLLQHAGKAVSSRRLKALKDGVADDAPADAGGGYLATMEQVIAFERLWKAEIDPEKKREYKRLLNEMSWAGKPRAFRGPEEKIRKAVDEAIGRAIQKIRERKMPKLAAHLHERLKRGWECTYIAQESLPQWEL
jgi:hypothetical protein